MINKVLGMELSPKQNNLTKPLYDLNVELIDDVVRQFCLTEGCDNDIPDWLFLKGKYNQDTKLCQDCRKERNKSMPRNKYFNKDAPKYTELKLYNNIQIDLNKYVEDGLFYFIKNTGDTRLYIIGGKYYMKDKAPFSAEDYDLKSMVYIKKSCFNDKNLFNIRVMEKSFIDEVTSLESKAIYYVIEDSKEQDINKRQGKLKYIINQVRLTKDASNVNFVIIDKISTGYNSLLKCVSGNKSRKKLSHFDIFIDDMINPLTLGKVDLQKDLEWFIKK